MGGSHDEAAPGATILTNCSLQPCSPMHHVPTACNPPPPTHAIASATMLSLETATQAPLSALSQDLLLP
mgnify:CR=1 FL=1